MPPTPKYNPEYHDDWAWSLAAKGAIDDEIADAFGISVRTLHRWKQEYPSFLQALTVGKEAADAKVEKSLYKRALGYDVKEKETLVETDKDGNVKPVKVKEGTKHVPPDTMAIMYWLNNRCKHTGEWAQTQKLELSGAVGNVNLSNLSEAELIALAKYADEHNGDSD